MSGSGMVTRLRRFFAPRAGAPRAGARAFTTPELLMTIVVFSFGLLPLIILFQRSFQTTAQAKNLMIAQSLGRTIIEEVRGLGFKGIEREIDNPTLNLFHSEFKQVKGKLVESDQKSIEYPEYYSRFETKLTYEEVKSETDKQTVNKYRVELEVKWKEPNRTFSYGFGTVVVPYGEK